MTSLVNTETGEIVEPMSVAEAEVVTDQIAWRLDNLATAHEEVMPMIREALTRRAWEALGYRSPGEYAAERFGGALTRLSIPVRQAVVQELTEAGMSTRAIAPVVGVSVGTVHADRQVFSTEHLARSPEASSSGSVPDAEAISSATLTSAVEALGAGQPEEAEASPPPPRSVIGLDGKSYRRPESVDRKALAKAAIDEFPDLSFYADSQDRVVSMAADLRRYRDRGELEMRLDSLRRSIAVERAERSGVDTTDMAAELNDEGVYEMRPYIAEPSPASSTTCPTCGQTVRN